MTVTVMVTIRMVATAVRMTVTTRVAEEEMVSIMPNRMESVGSRERATPPRSAPVG